MNNKVHNQEMELAWEFIETTSKSLFLTGKAGTGKTTFLHSLKAKSSKRMIVVAPTGVAAINAKGVTIHSFFQLPFGPILPAASTMQQQGNYKMRFGKEKIDIIKSLDLLIIDEISMVRADLLDGIDKVLRRYRTANHVFGGVQVLMIGDLHQLSPVINPNEWSLLEPYYETAYFFSSYSFQQADAISIELQHIYRQDNQQFITLLNEVRNNNLSQQSEQLLNQRYLPDFDSQKNKGYITLTSHNSRAQKINHTELAKLEQASQFYQAEITGVFNQHAYPTFENLELKQGAQVMFIKNDSSPEKRYYNGKIGEITKLSADEIQVKCPDDSQVITVTPEKWDNIKYNINPENQAITENITGSFSQMPLRLAWAITIHKSQGLTFDKAIIDAQASFAHGQTYVALSRCRTLEGIVLKDKINPRSIITDNTVLAYVKHVQQNPPSPQELKHAQNQYQLQLITEIFDYSDFVIPIKSCMKTYYQNRNSIKGTIIEVLAKILDDGISPLLTITTSFAKQLHGLNTAQQLPEDNSTIQERIKKARLYFHKHTEELIATPLQQLSFTTDNKATKKQLEKHLQSITELLKHKQTCLQSIENGFNSQAYRHQKVQSLLQNQKKPKTQKDYNDTTQHPELFEKLRTMRINLATEQEIAAFQIFSQQSLYAMCEFFPLTEQQLKTIHGMGKVRVEKYGKEIIRIIAEYVEKNNIQPPTVDANQQNTKKQSAKVSKKTETKSQSFALFQQGKSIAEIAKQRGLVNSTIEGHLSHFIATGELAITELLSQEKYKKLKKIIQNTTYEGLSDLKKQAGDDYSYGDLQMALAAIEHAKNTATNQDKKS